MNFVLSIRNLKRNYRPPKFTVIICINGIEITHTTYRSTHTTNRPVRLLVSGSPKRLTFGAIAGDIKAYIYM